MPAKIYFRDLQISTLLGQRKSKERVERIYLYFRKEKEREQSYTKTVSLEAVQQIVVFVCFFVFKKEWNRGQK